MVVHPQRHVLQGVTKRLCVGELPVAGLHPVDSLISAHQHRVEACLPSWSDHATLLFGESVIREAFSVHRSYGAASRSARNAARRADRATVEPLGGCEGERDALTTEDMVAPT